MTSLDREKQVGCCVRIQRGFMLERVVTTLTWQRETGGWVFPSTSCTQGVLTLLIYQRMGNRTVEFEVAGTVLMSSPGGVKKKSEHIPKGQHPPKPTFTVKAFLHAPQTDPF